MNAQELRLGNKVETPNGIATIQEIDTTNVEVYYGQYPDENTKVLKHDEIMPIPLTESHLEGFGLIKRYLENPFEDGGFYLDENGNKEYTWIMGAFNLEIQQNGEIWFEVYSHYLHIKYVHQLQNIYYALVQEELTEQIISTSTK